MDYKKWITSLVHTPSGLWSGSREGLLEQRDEQGRVLRKLSISGIDPTGCKERNTLRINCLSIADETKIFVGAPTCFVEYDTTASKVVSQCTTHLRDWVYCIHPLSDRTVLAATGTELQVWNREGWHEWTAGDTIQSERGVRQVQRPFISAVEALDEPRQLGIASFDGAVRVRDIVKNALSGTYQEHVGRVWSVVSIAPHCFASCADDATVKLWDLRERNSCHTISGFPGRVSCLLPRRDHRLITASCPDKPRQSDTKAEISFWDTRFFREERI